MPAVRPRTKKRWPERYSSTTGAIETSAPASTSGWFGRVAALELREARHQRAGVLVLQEDERDQQLVPDPDRLHDDERERRRARERHHHLPQHGEGPGALDRGGLDQLLRHGAEEVREEEDGERHEQAGVEDDHRLQVIDPAAVDHEHEHRHEQGHGRHDHQRDARRRGRSCARGSARRRRRRRRRGPPASRRRPT